MPDTPGLLPPTALAHIRKYDDEWDGQTVQLLLAHIDALTAAGGLREALENDVLPWLVEDRSVTRDDVIRRLRKVLAWTAMTEAPHDA